MVELERALRSLAERPDCGPEPLDELERRVAARRRRRSGRRSMAMVVLVVLLAAVPVLASRRDRDTVVHTGPVGQPRDPSAVIESPRPPTVEAQIPPGWQTLMADGDRLVLGTRPLAERDLLLAVLARNDVAFAGFPADGVVFVVGGDRLQAKYTMGEAGRSVSNGVEFVQTDVVGRPGPELALGEPRTLPGGVNVRRGDVPQSSVLLAAYTGPAAPADATQQAEAIAASVRLKAVNPADVAPPPPGSRPGFDGGEPAVAADDMRVAATVGHRGLSFSLYTGDGCAVVRSSSSTPPMTGGCSPERPQRGGLATVSVANAPLPPPLHAPGGPPAEWAGVQIVLVVARTGPDVQAVRAVLVDGRRVDAALGTDGWAFVVSDGRAFLLEAYDAAGRLLGEAPVR